MESVHLETTLSLENEVLQLVTIEGQVIFEKPQHQISISWRFFVVNDDLHVDLENPQMLKCIVYISKKMVSNFFPKVLF